MPWSRIVLLGWGREKIWQWEEHLGFHQAREEMGKADTGGKGGCPRQEKKKQSR